MSLILLDNEGTLTTKAASEWRGLIERLRKDGHIVCVATSAPFPEEGTGSDGELTADDFDLIIDNVCPKGDINILLPRVMEAYDGKLNALLLNGQEIVSREPPQKQDIVLIDDNMLNVMMLKKNKVPAVVYKSTMTCDDVYDAIQDVREKQGASHRVFPQVA